MAAQNPLIQRLAMAQGFVAAATELNQAYVTIQKYGQLFTQSGQAFAAGDFNGTSLAYIDPTTMPTLITELNAFVAWMNANAQSVFQAAPGTPVTV
jgi:hypothetical protein